MRLAEYLERHGIAVAEFAEAIEAEPMSVYRYCNGVRVPNRKLMARIVAATSGAVQPNDFYSLPIKPRGKKAV
jgi:transcriptional regulator with XRE-family HTH domain